MASVVGFTQAVHLSAKPVAQAAKKQRRGEAVIVIAKTHATSGGLKSTIGCQETFIALARLS